VEVRFSALVQTGPGAHPVSCTMGTGCFPGLESGRGVTLTLHPLLVPRYKNRVELYLVACKKSETYLLLIYQMLNKEKNRQYRNKQASGRKIN
jgi:hypothetical protein